MQENTAASWLLDTSILVDLLRGSAKARTWIDSVPEARRFISVITAAELIAGCDNRSEQRAVELEIESYAMLWLSKNISQAAIAFYKRFHLSHRVGFFDCLIAATARENNLGVGTLNTKHFAPLPNLQVAKPY